MTTLTERVLVACQRDALAPSGTRVAVALSGGGDSVALTLLLRELAPRAGFVLAGLVHLNHRLRPAASDDEEFCRALAQGLSLPIVVGVVDVREEARRDGVSVEEAGHRARYRFFAAACEEIEADRVATAHTRDDQAETLLMRMIRGAGPAGLAGIHPMAGRVIRPLLDVSRAELRSFLTERGQSYRDDASNRDVRVTRNRIRHELLPLLTRRFSAGVVETLARAAKIARHDAAWLDAGANALAGDIVIERGSRRVTLDRTALAHAPIALGRRVVKQVLECVTGGSVGFDDVERVLAMTGAPDTRAAADLRGCRVACRGRRLTVEPPRARRAESRRTFEYPLSVPGSVRVPEAGVTLSAERVDGGLQACGLTADGAVAHVDTGHLVDGLIVRSWKAGDICRPLGLRGRKKLQDLFVDRKVPRDARAAVPVVTDRDGAIVWVVGCTVSEDFRATPGREGMLILKARSLGGAG